MDTFYLRAVIVLVAVTIFLPDHGHARSECPVGSTSYQGNCFLESRGPMPFWEANNMCEMIGCVLAHADGDSERETLKSFQSSIGVTKDYWSGLFDLLEKDNWIDVRTGEPVKNTILWERTPSGNQNENCAFVYTDQLEYRATSCGSQKKFTCHCGYTGQSN